MPDYCTRGLPITLAVTGLVLADSSNSGDLPERTCGIPGKHQANPREATSLKVMQVLLMVSTQMPFHLILLMAFCFLIFNFFFYLKHFTNDIDQ